MSEVKPVESEVPAAVEDAATEKPAAAEEASATKETKSNDTSEEKNGKSDSRDNKRSNGRSYDDRRNSKKFKENVKTDFTSLPETDDPDDIRQQVEFYFRDSNLVQDKFLFNLVGGSENNWVDIKTLHNFKRMRRFQPYSAVVSALKESEVLDVNDKDQIRRKEALPEDAGTEYDESRNAAIQVFEDRAMPRSVYAKGFGQEGSSTQFDIEAFFAPYGPVNAVRLRRGNNKLFKGSVFVEFDNEETAKAFLALDPKPKFNGNELLVLSKKAYCDQKVEDIKSGKIRPNDRSERNERGSRGGRGGRGRGGRSNGRDRRDNDRRRDDRDGRDDRDWKGRRDNFQKSRDFEKNQKDGKKEEDKAPAKDANGVPIVEVVSEDQARKDPLAEKPIAFDEAEEQERKKRTRADDDEGDNEAKKTKVDSEE